MGQKAPVIFLGYRQTMQSMKKIAESSYGPKSSCIFLGHRQTMQSMKKIAKSSYGPKSSCIFLGCRQTMQSTKKIAESSYGPKSSCIFLGYRQTMQSMKKIFQAVSSVFVICNVKTVMIVRKICIIWWTTDAGAKMLLTYVANLLVNNLLTIQ